MKQFVTGIASVVVLSVLVAGCDVKSNSSAKESADVPLSASELSVLMDFHAWKVAIPPSPQPIKSIRLVIVKPDGTVVEKFATGEHSFTEPCASILLGFRIEGDTFTGHLNVTDAKGGGIGWKFNFTDKIADSLMGWMGEKLYWQGNRATIASAAQGELNGSFLAIELVK